MSRYYSSSSDHADTNTPWLTGSTGGYGSWVNQDNQSANKHFMVSGTTDLAEALALATDFQSGTGKPSAQSRHSNSAVQAITSTALSTNVWEFVTAGWNGTMYRQATHGTGINKGTGSSGNAPTGMTKSRIGARLDGANTAHAMMAHSMVFSAMPSDIQISFLANGGNPRYLGSIVKAYYKQDPAAGSTETDQIGSNNLTVTGTTAGGSDPNIATYWTAVGLGNQSYTQGTAISAVDLTTKFDNVLSAYTCALKQLGTATQPTNASGAGSGRTINVGSATAFSAGDYMSVGAGAPTIVLQVSGNTLLVGSDQSWNDNDLVYRYAVNARTFSAGPVITGNSLGGTPGAPDVGTYNNCFIRATCNGNASAFSDSPLFNITVAASTSAPSFSSGPTLNSPSTDGFSFSATSNQNATWYAVAMLRGSSAPSAAQVKSGSPTGFVSRVSIALTSGAAGSLAFTGLTLPVYDIYHVVDNGSGTSSVVSVTSQMKLPPAGKQYVTATLTTISAITKATHAQVTTPGHGLVTGDYVEIFGVGGMVEINGTLDTVTVVDANTFTLNNTDSTAFTTYTSGGTVTRGQSIAYNASPTLQTNDIFIVDTMTAQGNALTVDTQGVPSIPVSAPRQSFVADAYSVSAASLVGQQTFFVNGVAPSPPPPDGLPSPLFAPLLQPIDLDLADAATDPQGDALTVAVLSGLPPGLSIVGKDLQGAATTPGTYPATLSWQNQAYETVQSGLLIIVGQVTVPDCTTAGDVLSALSLLDQAYLSGIATYIPSGAPTGTILSQMPPAGTLLDPGSVVTLLLSDGVAPSTQQGTGGSGGSGGGSGTNGMSKADIEAMLEAEQALVATIRKAYRYTVLGIDDDAPPKATPRPMPAPSPSKPGSPPSAAAQQALVAALKGKGDQGVSILNKLTK